MARVDGLVLLHPVLHGIQGRPRQHVSDILRGALVLAVGALDALVLDSVIEGIPNAAKGGELGGKVTNWVKENPELLLKGLAGENPTDALVALCREKLQNLTFQRSSMIEGVIRDVLRREGVWTRAAALLSSGGKRWTDQEVKDKLDEFVERRHRIAHSGDVRAGSTATRPIRREYVEEAIRVIRAVGVGVTETVT